MFHRHRLSPYTATQVRVDLSHHRRDLRWTQKLPQLYIASIASLGRIVQFSAGQRSPGRATFSASKLVQYGHSCRAFRRLRHGMIVSVPGIRQSRAPQSFRQFADLAPAVPIGEIEPLYCVNQIQQGLFLQWSSRLLLGFCRKPLLPLSEMLHQCQGHPPDPSKRAWLLVPQKPSHAWCMQVAPGTTHTFLREPWLTWIVSCKASPDHLANLLH